jgi:putative sigma-54 modulation protein
VPIQAEIPPDVAELEMAKAMEEEEEETPAGPQIVKTKQFGIKPMAPEEAALQMELIGHDFFVFRNAESNDTNVIYRRRDGNYGLIEPK